MPFSSAFHRENLMRTKEYLPSTLFASSVAWTRTGKSSTLTKVMPGPIDPDGPAPPDAVLIAIGIVTDSNQLKVGPVGNWSSYSGETYNKKFSDAKYTFTILKPKNDPVFATDFPATVTALKKLQTQISKTGQNKWLIVQDGQEDAIRFSFHVFDKKNETNSDTNIDIRSWPVPTECRDALEKISDTHVIRPFLVFDANNARITNPFDIASKITGALVECQFTLIHHGIGDSDSFCGEIQQVTILRPPQIKPPSPYKSAIGPYRPVTLSPEEIRLHAEQQRAVSAFTLPIPSAGPSNLPIQSKRKASEEPEGSAAKRVNTDEKNKPEGAGQANIATGKGKEKQSNAQPGEGEGET
ncbi:hypothetical protein C8R46DRAFT_1253561 [Mycena filopes]|nr:hypothetical protein C8R46DRAFT_1253561 [Mycena filopes]